MLVIVLLHVDKANPDRPNVNFTQKREVDKLVNGHPQHDIKHYYEQRYFFRY